MRVLKSNRGFTLVELIVVMTVIGIIVAVIIPNLKGMQDDGQLTKADKELETLRTAIVSYWKNHNMVYPSNIHTDLANSSPKIVMPIIRDPWTTDTANNTYGYVKGNDSTFGDYFAVYTHGPLHDTAPSWDASAQKMVFSGSGRVVSNAGIVKQ